MPFVIDPSWKRRLGRAALFGLVAGVLGLGAAFVTGAGFVFLFPGFVLGMIFGLIPFEGDAVGFYILVATTINCLFYSGCFYLGSLVWSGARTNNVVASHGNS